MVSRATILNIRVNTAICHTGRKNAPDSVLLNCKGGKSVTGKEKLHKVGIVSQCGEEKLGRKASNLCVKARRQA